MLKSFPAEANCLFLGYPVQMPTCGGASIFLSAVTFPWLQCYVAKVFVQITNRSIHLPKTVDKTTLHANTYQPLRALTLSRSSRQRFRIESAQPSSDFNQFRRRRNPEMQESQTCYRQRQYPDPIVTIVSTQRQSLQQPVHSGSPSEAVIELHISCRFSRCQPRSPMVAAETTFV